MVVLFANLSMSISCLRVLVWVLRGFIIGNSNVFATGLPALNLNMHDRGKNPQSQSESFPLT